MRPRDEKDIVEVEYELEELKDRIGSSRGSQFALLKNELGLDRTLTKLNLQSNLRGLRKGCSHGFVFEPDKNRWYHWWTYFILLWAMYSSVFTPLEFGFFRGLPDNVFWLDIAGQVAFLADIVVQFFLAYRDAQTYRMVHNRSLIACRYFKSGFMFDFLGCLPWDAIYKACGRKEEVRYLLWIRLTRVRKVTDFFHKLEKDIRINYLFIRIVKLIVVEVYCAHTGACIFYYLATTLPASKEGYTWIGSLKLGDYSYANFRDIDIGKCYLVSLYFAIVTMATVGYGDIHAVNPREMIFIMIYVSFDMILGAYLIGNMTALIVKGSKTERFRDKMTDLIKYMNRNKLGKDMCDQIKGHVRLQYESSYMEVAVLQDIPVSIRAKISQQLYKPCIQKVSLFQGCSSDFINQIVIRLHEELFLPGEVIMEQGNTVDQLYFVCHGELEGVGIGEDGSEEILLSFKPDSTFGEIAILCNIAQPYTIRVCDLCRLLRIDKQSFTDILQMYFFDGRTILSNLLEGKESNFWIKQLESDVALLIGKKEAEFALRVNSAAYNGDLDHLKNLVRGGADPKKTDYDGRSPLHLAASRGYEDITHFLIQERVEINLSDKFGNTPLLEAIKHGNDQVASLLFKKGATLKVEDAGSFLCMAVARGDSNFLRRVLSYDIDPNSTDYDHRTPLHIAAAEGLYLMVKILLEAGASVFSKDRWGNTPLDEAQIRGSKPLIRLLEDAKSSQLSEFPNCSQDIRDKVHPKKCTVFPFHPWDSEEKRREGVVLWIPHTLEELIKSSEEQLKCTCTCILSEAGGKIYDIDLICDDQMLYLLTADDGQFH